MKNLKNYIFFGIYCFLNPRLLKLIFCKVYIPVYIQYEWLNEYDIGTVVDVGAYHGHVSRGLNYLFPEATIYAFEPIEECCRIIKSKPFFKNIVLESSALSDKVGKATFYKNYCVPASSLLPVDQKARRKYRFMAETKKIKVNTTTLDTYFKDKKLKESIFLKIDVQGVEHLVLKGGKDLLKRVSVIHVETSFEGLYKGQCLFEEIYNYLTGLGFRYLGEIPCSDFYPSFQLRGRVNSIFINSRKKPEKHGE